MKNLLAVIAISFLCAPALAAEEAAPAATADSSTQDCAKEVWPHISPDCLRNADKAIKVRLVTAPRQARSD